MTTRQILVLFVSMGLSACKGESRIDTWVDGYCSQLSVDLARRAKNAANDGTSAETRRALGLEFHRSLLFCLNTRAGSMEAHAPLERRETDAVAAYGETNDATVSARALGDLAAVAEEIYKLPIAK